MIQVLTSPGKYVQGADALKKVGQYLKPLGSHALIISDPAVLNLVESSLVPGLGGMRWTVDKFSGEASQQEIDRLQGVAQRAAADVIVGFGGGKTLDTAGVAYYFWVFRPASFY